MAPTTLTLKEKIVYLEKIESRGSRSLKDAASGLGLPFATVRRIWEDRVAIRKSWKSASRKPNSKKTRVSNTNIKLTSNRAPNIKRLKGNENNTDIEKGVLMWYKDMIHSEALVTEAIIRQKAMQIAENLGLNTFKASLNWLTQFRNKNQVVLNSDDLISQEITNKNLQKSKRYHSQQEIRKNSNSGGNRNSLPSNIDHSIKSDVKELPSLSDAYAALATLEQWYLGNESTCQLRVLPIIRQDLRYLRCKGEKRKIQGGNRIR
ncbi:unnamed protein product [Meganyctiphanes norvegica]|uniref:HTH CENPB-type domain-containing protein n=1 Tax=Meganyctiphanes norvegica TaxID=48144 RepID=A0AAV2R6C5_MEGNR